MPIPVSVMFDEVYDLLDDYPPVSPPERYPTDDMVRHYLNMGQYAMYPRIFRTVSSDVETTLYPQQYRFSDELAWGRVAYVEGLDTNGVFVMAPDESYDIIPAADGRHIVRVRDEYRTSLTAANIRVTVSQPLLPIEPPVTGFMALEHGGGNGDGMRMVGTGGAGVVASRALSSGNGDGAGGVAVMAPPAPPVIEVRVAYEGQMFSGPDFAVEAPPLYAMARICSRGLHRRLDYGRVSVEYGNRSAMPNELMSAAVYFLDEFERRVDQWRTVLPQSLA